MNDTQKLVARTIDNIGLMHASLVSLRDGVLPLNPQLFAVMAEGPIEDLRKLLNDYDELVARTDFAERKVAPPLEEAAIAA